jgi:zinc/manganese transport system permease protein
VLLIFALLVAPGAIAERIARRPAAALAISGGLAVLITWISLALAYYTPYPVSFYVTSLAFAGYLAARAWTSWARRAGRARRPAPLRRGHRDAGVEAAETATVRT